ncbi:MAG: hypothetical protein IJW46_00260 [Clostridia bacterium]|nr:hypothetical protein [Clostridia bacterium]
MEKEMQKYRALNQLAEQHGNVIFGGSGDKQIPLGELQQAFSLDAQFYNRSFADLSINDAVQAYDACVSKLHPENLFLHIGEADLDGFKKDPAEFDCKYRDLIAHIRSLDKKCNIVIVSLKNYEKNPLIEEMNKHLKYIADSERCEYGDIAAKRVWNPKETKDVMSFLYYTGFVHPLKGKRPVWDLIKILFCYEPACIV